MIASGLQNVQFYAVNTDLQALAAFEGSDNRIPLGTQAHRGTRGRAVFRRWGRRRRMEDKEMLQDVIRGADMVFITAGMGGGNGYGSRPGHRVHRAGDEHPDRRRRHEAVPVRRSAQDGARRRRASRSCASAVDTLLTIPNQHLLKIVERQTPISQAFLMADDVLRQGVQGISDLITKAGDINIDFADVRTIMKGQGDALMGIGIGRGDNRAVDAATNAINNPLLEDARIEGAKGILVNVTGGNDFSLTEYEEVLRIITANADREALVIAGSAVDETFDDECRVIVIATGFESDHTQAEEEPVEAKGKDEYMPYKEWMDLNNGISRKGPQDPYSGSQIKEADIYIPTVLRDKRISGSKSEN